MEVNIFKVGQANCTICKKGKKLLFYDCGYKIDNWNRMGRLTKSKKHIFEHIMNSVEEIVVVISHNDFDHKNLILPLISLFKENNFVVPQTIDKIEFLSKLNENNIINNNNDDKNDNNNENNNNKNENEKKIYEEKKKKLISFLKPEFHIEPIDPQLEKSVNKNDNSLILKIIGNFKNKKQFSLFFTGDATSKTEEKIRNDDIYKDILLHMPSHHGSSTNDSLIVSKKVYSLSKYPVLTIISSDPAYNNKIPTMNTIKKLCDMISSNLKNINDDNKKYYCIPHNISCSISDITVKINNENEKDQKYKNGKNDQEDENEKDQKYKNGKNDQEDENDQVNEKIFELIKYPSFKNDFIIPMFVTSDSLTFGYKITINSENLILTDDIIVDEKKDLYINEPFYVFSCQKDGDNDVTFSDKIKIIESYIPFFSIKNIKDMNNMKNNIELKSQNISPLIDIEMIEILNKYTIDKYLKKSKNFFINSFKVNNFNIMSLINFEIFMNTKSKFLLLKNKSDIENFINLALKLKLSLEEIINILNLCCNYLKESDLSIKTKINEIISEVNKKLKEINMKNNMNENIINILSLKTGNKRKRDQSN